MYFKNLLFCAFATAIAASILFSLYQQFMVTPIILAAEIYETPEVTSSLHAEPWSPEQGLERSLFTLSANFLTTFAYALILLSAMALTDNIRPVQGLLWGGAGYLAFFIAPALGLPPEIPGMEAAQLEGRQIWWLASVTFTIGGLWLLAFGSFRLKAVSLFLLAAPHLLGAPQAEKHGFSHPDPVAVEALIDLWHQFILQTSLANALLWLIIGCVSAFLAARFIIPLNESN